jgi:hypothetical protein
MIEEYEKFCNDFQNDPEIGSDLPMNRLYHPNSDFLSPSLLLKKRKIEQFINEMKTIVKAMETNECEIEKINNILSLIDVYNNSDDEFNFGPESDDDDVNPSNIFIKQMEKENANQMNANQMNANQMNTNQMNTNQMNANQMNKGPTNTIDDSYNNFISKLNDTSKRIFKNDDNKYLDNYIKLSNIY